MASIPSQARVGFWTALGVFAALVVFRYIEKRLP